jgi:uncharacterized protein (TIGR02266 family)
MPVSDPQNRRQFARVRLEVKVDLRSEDTFYTGFSENISEGGLFICTDSPFKIGDELEMTLSLMGGPPTPHRAVVRWLRPEEASGGLPAGIGVQFVDLDPATHQELQGFVDSRLKDTLFIDLD